MVRNASAFLFWNGGLDIIFRYAHLERKQNYILNEIESDYDNI